MFQALIENEPVLRDPRGALWRARGDLHELDGRSRAGARNAHHLLFWHVIAEMKAAGCRALDLGGYTTNEKYGAYKRGMKGREYRLAGEWLAF